MGFFSKYIGHRSEGSKKLDNRIPSVPGNERTDSMKRVKAFINTGSEQVWVSGNGVQQLVDKAVAMSMTSVSKRFIKMTVKVFFKASLRRGFAKHFLFFSLYII